MGFASSTRSVRIRRATDADCEGILFCLTSAFQPYQASYTPAAFEDTVLTPNALRRRLMKMSVFVAVGEAGEVVGTIACGTVTPEEGHLRGMAVLPPWQGRGVAKALLKRAQTELHEHGCRRITLDTTEPLVSAMRFYERNGFCRTGKVTDFFGMPLIEYAKEPQPPCQQELARSLA